MFIVAHIVLCAVLSLTLMSLLRNTLWTAVSISRENTTTIMKSVNASNITSPSDMTPQEFHTYNRLAEQMTFYHSILRQNWDELSAGAAPGASKPSAKGLIRIGLQFCRHLKGHHDIEEAMWFPALGKKMEGFLPGHFAQEQHKEMHKGLDVLTAYLESCASGKKELKRDTVRSVMDSFGGILWNHMDEEVAELGALNMRKFWTVREMQSFPF